MPLALMVGGACRKHECVRMQAHGEAISTILSYYLYAEAPKAQGIFFYSSFHKAPCSAHSQTRPLLLLYQPALLLCHEHQELSKQNALVYFTCTP